MNAQRIRIYYLFHTLSSNLFLSKLVLHLFLVTFDHLFFTPDEVFLIGGVSEATACVDVFHLTLKTTRKIKDMSLARSRCAAASSTREIIVCGGFGQPERERSCEIYSNTLDKWVYLFFLLTNHYLKSISI